MFNTWDNLGAVAVSKARPVRQGGHALPKVKLAPAVAPRLAPTPVRGCALTSEQVAFLRAHGGDIPHTGLDPATAARYQGWGWMRRVGDNWDLALPDTSGCFGSNAGRTPTPPYIPNPLPYKPPPPQLGPSVPSVPITPTIAVPTRPKRLPRPMRPKETMPVGRGEICPSYGHVNRPIPGVDEYQVVRCTPGQRVVIDRGLARAVRSEAFARHPGGGRERAGQAGDYRGGVSAGYSGVTSGGNVVSGASSGLAGGLSGSICLPTWTLLVAVGAFFLMKRR